jgi:IclR family transcriptional regulator, KDG regulon repressor
MREVPALARGLRILELLAEVKQPMRVADIAVRLDIPRSATYELINTLRLHRFLDQDSDGRLMLGAKLGMLGASFESGVDLPRMAAEAARTLRDRCDETVQVAVLDDRYVLNIAKADSSRQLRLVSNLGRRLPAHVTGLGKVLLAALPPEEFDRRMAGVQLETYTSTSIADLDALRAELANVRRAGFAIDNAESTTEVRGVAAPIQDTSGETIAAISISVPVIRMTDDRLTECTILVRDAADGLSRRLGYGLLGPEALAGITA